MPKPPWMQATKLLGLLAAILIPLTTLSTAASAAAPSRTFPAGQPRPGSSAQPVQVLPPPGSTPVPDGPANTAYQLPPGAIGVRVQLPPPGAPMPATLPSTAVYPGQANATAPANSFECDYGANDPFSPFQGVMEAAASAWCRGVTGVKVTATLWWWSGSSWKWQDAGTGSGGPGKWVFAYAFHGCASGTTHWWHASADVDVIFDGQQIGLRRYNTPNVDPKCK